MGYGEIIKKRLHEKGVTVADLSRAINIPASTIYAMMRRDNEKINYGTAKQIAAFFNIPVEQFLLEGASIDVSVESDNTQKNKNESTLLKSFRILNDSGQQVAIERVEELTEIPKYQKGQ